MFSVLVPGSMRYGVPCGTRDFPIRGYSRGLLEIFISGCRCGDLNLGMGRKEISSSDVDDDGHYSWMGSISDTSAYRGDVRRSLLEGGNLR